MLKEDLEKYAKEFPLPAAGFAEVYSADHYTRTTLFKDDHIEIVVICFLPGQTSSVHDHKGSNCVVRMIKGKMLETLFAQEENGDYSVSSYHYLTTGDISGLDGTQIHQLANVSSDGSILLNFYSPPFK